jgi:hypothetical protein
MVAARESVALAERIIAETAEKDRVADGGSPWIWECRERKPNDDQPGLRH